MKYLSLLIILFSINYFPADYKSALRLKEGDVISAEVFNDILDRIELTLKAIETSELVGTWDVTWKTCTNGGPGNCSPISGINLGSGWTNDPDNLFRTRRDTWLVSDDGDGTYSVSMNKCLVGSVGEGENEKHYDDPCSARINVDSGIMLYGIISATAPIAPAVDKHTGAYKIKRVSDSRYLLWFLSSANDSFLSLQLDKKNTVPNPPTNFTATLESGTSSKVIFSWTASEGSVDSYIIKSKNSATGTFSNLQTGIINTDSFTDTLTSGTRWYRIFAVDSNGTSIGSNVVSVSR